MVWNYFASGHGKGEVDKARALLKREIRKEQIKPNACKLQCAYDVVKYLKEEAMRQHVAYFNVKRTVHKFFWEMKNGDVDRIQLYECQQHMVATRRIKFNLFHIEI
jgi:hypothetical protein